MVPKIHLLDGGTLYEINKKYNDLGETCINDNPEYVTSTVQAKYQRFDMGKLFI